MLISALLSSWLGQVQTQTPPPAPPQVIEEQFEVVKSYTGEVTAYTSREEETDDTPFIAASGATVHWGMIASNAYPFGTRVRFPEIYGDKIFIVKDRMHSRFQNRVDIWFPEYSNARHFGLKNTKIEIVRLASTNQLSVK